MKVDPSKYDYIMYVDASGDDGFQFENGSSTCYSAAAFLVKQADIQHNLAILNQIKKTVGCKETDEVKYSRIRRNRYGAKALELLRGLKGKMACYTFFKKELPPEEIPAKGSKTLSVICHIMALESLDRFSFADGERVLVAIDRMKHTEEAPLEYMFEEGVLSGKEHPERNFTVDTVFRDSKDASFLLIQIADLLCGTIREHFEQYEDNADMQHFQAVCPKCLWFRRAKKHTTHKMCSNGRSRAARILTSKNFHNIYGLIPQFSTTHMFDFFFVNPAKMMDKHFYLVCSKK